jgi:hypothetical protein
MAQMTPGQGTGAGLAWLGQGPVQRSSFCVTFVRGLTQEEVLAGFGADPSVAVDRTLEQAEAGEASVLESFGPYVRAGRSAGWVFAWEEATHEGTRREVLRNVSRRQDAVVVRHVLDAFAEFGYAAYGEVVSHLLTIPPFTRTGTEPDRFLPLLQQVGLDFGAAAQLCAAGEVTALSGLQAVLAVAERAFGLSLTPQQVEGAWPSSRILPLLEDLSAADWNGPDWEFGVGDPVLDLLVRHASAQEVAALVAAQSRAVLEETNLGRFAVLADAVRAAADGQLVDITNDSPVGVLLREAAREGYVMESYAVWGSSSARIPADEQRAGLMRAAAVRPLRVVLADSGSLPALAEILVYRKTWAAPGWRGQVLDGLRGVRAPAEQLRAAEQRRLEQASAPPWEPWSPEG